MRPVILDGHNDLALRVWLGQEPVHIALATAGEAGFDGGFFALSAVGGPFEHPTGVPYELPLDEPVPFERALADVEGELAALEALDLSLIHI